MRIALICVPYAGDVARWGAANGPQAFLDQGLRLELERRRHTVSDPVWIEFPRAERTRDTVTNLGRIAARTSDAVHAALAGGSDLALVLEGNCTHAPGAIGGVARAAGGAGVGVVWFDAHGDMNTMATTQTGLWGGMPYAVTLGWDLDDWRLAAGLEPPVRPEAAALIGASDLDQAEIDALERHPILRMDATDMLEPGVAGRLGTSLRPRAGEAPAWYVHVDVDVAGPEEVPGALTPAPLWPPRAHLIEAAAAVAQTVPVRAIGLAAYDPAGDPSRRGARFGMDMALAVVDAMRVVV
ncbi:MAG TPA: arginase family protein [Ktedonobacterales bacterium]